ncbi:MAG TPA: MBL fold metallo-hydrolase [Verrucomicrobiae bacterium]|nr:MBL fold metallo-hydrolase [Verrucomicrobiae bacterium]
MWSYLLMGVAVVLLAVILYPLWGGIRYVIRQRQREGNIIIGQPRHKPVPQQWRSDQTTIAWLGHATLLINLHGKFILTDPVFSSSVGLHLPFGMNLGPRRLVRPALQPDELPPLDLILQSHAHMDHLDVRSWRELQPGPAVVMATRNQRFIRHLGFAPVTELGWGDSVNAAGVTVTAVKIKHWGERYPWSRGLGYNAYLLEHNGTTILFGGDTADTDSLRQACASRKIRVAILPIGGYRPYIHMHASPEQTWKMFRELGADFLVPIHHQTFLLSYEPPDEPLRRLIASAGGQADRIVIHEIGETFVVP